MQGFQLLCDTRETRCVGHHPTYYVLNPLQSLQFGLLDVIEKCITIVEATAD